MIHDFDDFCLWMYVVIDDTWRQIAWLFERPGPAPQCSDSELLTMALVGECRGWDLETVMLAEWRGASRSVPPHPDAEPLQPAAAQPDVRRQPDTANCPARPRLGR